MTRLKQCRRLNCHDKLLATPTGATLMRRVRNNCRVMSTYSTRVGSHLTGCHLPSTTLFILKRCTYTSSPLWLSQQAAALALVNCVKKARKGWLMMLVLEAGCLWLAWQLAFTKGSRLTT